MLITPRERHPTSPGLTHEDHLVRNGTCRLNIGLHVMQFHMNVTVQLCKRCYNLTQDDTSILYSPNSKRGTSFPGVITKMQEHNIMYRIIYMLF